MCSSDLKPLKDVVEGGLMVGVGGGVTVPVQFAFTDEAPVLSISIFSEYVPTNKITPARNMNEGPGENRDLFFCLEGGPDDL